MELLITKSYQCWKAYSILKIGTEPDWSDISREVADMLIKEGVAKYVYKNKQMTNYKGK